MGSGNGTLDGGELVLVVDTLTGEVSGTTVRDLQDDGGLGIAGSLEGSYHGGRGCAVDGRDGVLLLAGVLEEGKDVISVDDTRLSGQNSLGTHLGVVVVVVVVVMVEELRIGEMGNNVEEGKRSSEESRRGISWSL